MKTYDKLYDIAEIEKMSPRELGNILSKEESELAELKEKTDQLGERYKGGAPYQLFIKAWSESRDKSDEVDRARRKFDKAHRDGEDKIESFLGIIEDLRSATIDFVETRRHVRGLAIDYQADRLHLEFIESWYVASSQECLCEILRFSLAKAKEDEKKKLGDHENTA